MTSGGTDSYRGAHRFQIRGDRLTNSAANVAALRATWLDRRLINGDALGPADDGDFDHGAWHISCHLVAAAGVRRTVSGDLLWLEISHDAARDRYFASITHARKGSALGVFPIDSAEGRELLDGSNLLGFVEGNSTGRTSARSRTDSPTAFNLLRRQDFDQSIGSADDGGKVWEHWCTLRDVEENAEMGTSVLTAYISLLAALGDIFPATIARGRSEHAHPIQLCAMIDAGVTTEAAATFDIAPIALPEALACEMLTANPVKCCLACENLEWSTTPRYFMYKRRIGSWLNAEGVAAALRKFRDVNP